MPSPKLFRVVRLVRLARILRLLETEVFKDLLAMIHGMKSGLLTLFWAVIVFFIVVYVVALVARSLLGVDENSQIQNRSGELLREYFENVPQSMFTVFRCSFGDCSTLSGVPIAAHIEEGYGGAVALGYSGTLFFITIGLFNIISAIFVDATMLAQAEIASRRAQDKLADERLWSGNVMKILKALLHATQDEDMRHMLSSQASGELNVNIDEVMQVEFHREVIADVIANNAIVKEALDNLDIEPEDHKRLSDILDPDHSGTIGTLELINGLARLRGAPRRSDVVTVDLMVRALQEDVEQITTTLNSVSMDLAAVVQGEKYQLAQEKRLEDIMKQVRSGVKWELERQLNKVAARTSTQQNPLLEL
jgi:hypothetical protein